MAIGTKEDFKIYNEEFFGGLIEVLEQNTEAFNAASMNALRLVTARKKGDFEKESFVKKIGGLVSRRDVTSTAGVTDKKIEQGELVGVKINRKIGPVAQTLDAFRKISQDPQELSYILGKQAGVDVAADYINTALAAVSAALSGVSQLNFDNTGNNPATLTHGTLVKGMAKMGDAAGRIACWVMHSKPYYDLVGQAIADKVFEVAGVTIYKGTVPTFNKPTIVIDSPSLVTGDPDGAGALTQGFVILGLTENAAEVNESEEREIVSDLITGQENLGLRVQGEYAFNLKQKGFAWDVVNGGVNPTDAAIATQTNWDKQFTDYKSLGGVRILVG